jgi:cytochrome c oxidase cbb3-type subunit 1
MEPFVVNFIRASLVWLGLGVLLGLWMALDPTGALVYRPAHMHANLLGFVSMMIFGVAYHVLPRFAGRPLWSNRVAAVHFVVANAGLALMVAGWGTRTSLPSVGAAALAAGAVASTAGAFLFITNIWRTIGPARVLVAVRRGRAV